MTVRAMAAGIVSCVATTVFAQTPPPPLRPLGPIMRVSTAPLASIAAAVPLRDGHVLINDITAHRVLLLDSTLSKAVVVADSSGATGSAYGKQPGTLLPYHRDSALFIDPASLSMLVLGPTGAIARVMAIPRPDEAQFLIGDIFGTPGIDSRDRLAYYNGPPSVSGIWLMGRGARLNRSGEPDSTRNRPVVSRTDSAFVVRVDLATRTVDTAVSFKVPKSTTSHYTDQQGMITSVHRTPDPLPVIDDWTMLPDGSIAVVRGRDYHVDWIMPDGTRSSSAKLPFDWQRVSGDQKTALIDSTVKARQAQFDDAYARVAADLGPGGTGGRSGGSGGGSAARGGASPAIIPTIVDRPSLDDLPDYMPPFTRGAARADADGHLWIRTTAMVKGQPVYDIVNRRGELVDRVQLPPFRTIAGFGPGVIYMAVKDGAGVVHLERARVK